MAAKYQLITELYRRTGITVAKNPQAWQSFLAAACRNYKCRFDEQLLIYAQRPDAIAVAELDTWNKRFKRWVNKETVRALPFSTRRVAGIPLNIILMFRTRTTDITAAAPSRYGR